VGETGGYDPGHRRRRHAAAGLCLGLPMTAAVALVCGGGTDAGLAVASATASADGVVAIPSDAASQAAEYWSERLSGTARPTAPGSPRPAPSGSAPAAQVLADPLLPSPATAPDVPSAPGGAGEPQASSEQPPRPGGESAVSGTPMAVSDPLTGKPFGGLPQVGALFNTSSGSPTSHYCSGSVVSTPQGDIVMTAAHCVYDSSSGGAESDMAFVPDYANGKDPYGVWVPSAVIVSPQWMADSDPDYDVAFLVVHRSGSKAKIQDVVGADTLAVNRPRAALTQVVGYPATADQPITCTNYTAAFSPTQLVWDCGGYPSGTSGSPFLTDVDSLTGYGTVVGVIGGFETGGDSPDVSYSISFGTAIAQLLAQAEAHG
jgi:V8-like Glu-specific endopeptidase